MKPSLPTLLSLNAGYVDTAGFLALQGLFTAHVTGNFVTFGAAAVYGRGLRHRPQRSEHGVKVKSASKT